MAIACFSILLTSALQQPQPPLLNRRSALQGLAGFAAAAPSAAAFASPVLDGYDPASAVTRPAAGRNFFPPLTPPLTNRATYRYELGRDAWALEQLLTFANVSATVRTVVIKLKDGTLWVNGPQWPTGEFCALLDELGPVGHVVLPCVALEHKAPMKAFCKRYPTASVWVAPGQYGPFGECGFDASKSKMGYRVDGIFSPGAPPSDGSPLPPWMDEFDYRTLYVDLPENAGPVAEVAFLHKPTSSLVTTDSVIYVPESAPPIFGTYFDQKTVAEPTFWPKSVIQAVFLPLREDPNADIADIVRRWPGYGATSGRLIRAPILRAFADARAPDEVRRWVSSISEWKFDRVLTAHFASPIKATPKEYADAFSYLSGPSADPPIACQDWKLLDGLNDLIETNKLGAPVKYDFKAGCPKV